MEVQSVDEHLPRRDPNPFTRGEKQLQEAIDREPSAAELKEELKEEEESRRRRSRVDDFIHSKNDFPKVMAGMSLEQKEQFADAYKQAGNVFFVEKNYAWAVQTYKILFARHKGNLSLMGGDPNARMPFSDNAYHTMLQCWSNSAACHIKQAEFRKAEEACNKGLNLEFSIPAASKAKLFYRRAESLLAQAKTEAAFDDLKHAIQLQPKDLGIRRTYEQVKKEVSDIRKTEFDGAKSTWAGKLSLGTNNLYADHPNPTLQAESEVVSVEENSG
eukprot:gene9888-11711_t